MRITESKLRRIIRRRLVERTILNEQDPTRRSALKAIFGLGAIAGGVSSSKDAKANPAVNRALFRFKDRIKDLIKQKHGEIEKNQLDALNAVFNEFMQKVEKGEKLSMDDIATLCMEKDLDPKYYGILRTEFNRMIGNLGKPLNKRKF